LNLPAILSPVRRRDGEGRKGEGLEGWGGEGRGAEGRVKGLGHHTCSHSSWLFKTGSSLWEIVGRTEDNIECVSDLWARTHPVHWTTHSVTHMHTVTVGLRIVATHPSSDVQGVVEA
jgi:hypothetical protein